MTDRRYLRMAAAVAVGVLALGVDGSLTARAASELIGDGEAGADLYAAQCRGCHTVSIAPTLRGVIDRRIASVSEFGGYSEGLKARSAETWTAENLNAFLAAPQAFAPGTRMVVTVPDAQARADIIAYVGSLPAPRAAR